MCELIDNRQSTIDNRHHSCATGEVATARATTPSRSKPPSRDCALSRRTSMRDAAERSVARCRKHTRARLTGSFAFLVCVSRDAQAAQTRARKMRARVFLHIATCVVNPPHATRERDTRARYSHHSRDAHHLSQHVAASPKHVRARALAR